MGEGGVGPAWDEEVNGDVGVVGWGIWGAEVMGKVLGQGFDGRFGGVVGWIVGARRVSDALFGSSYYD